MKKPILFTCLIFFVTLAKAQVFESEDFSTFNTGNIGTSISGTIPGQGGFFTSAVSFNGSTTTNNNNNNFQIVTDLQTGKKLQITGPNGTSARKSMWKEGLQTKWNNRTVGNDVVQLSFTFNTGFATTSENYFGMQLFDSNLNFTLGYSYNTMTRELLGVAYVNIGGSLVNSSFVLDTNGLILAQNTTYTLRCSYDFNTGEVLWNPDARPISIGLPNSYWVPNQQLVRLDFLGSSLQPGTSHGNVGSASVFFEDYELKAVNVSELLSNDEVVQSEITLYPNPSDDVLNLTIESFRPSNLKIYDLSGRTVKSLNLDSEKIIIDVSDLNSGIYMLMITNDLGSVSSKFIKN
ncbi:hypothetical protein BBFL7_01913 [Flavobacteria bacterium BBFL7]|nr:hypothetical protein BBFL7_01913 [Flavobacteria bacterium BBFL7]